MADKVVFSLCMDKYTHYQKRFTIENAYPIGVGIRFHLGNSIRLMD